MKFTFEPEAKKYMEKKNFQELTVDVTVSGGCGGGGVANASLRAGTPLKDKNTYKEEVVEGITIHYPSYFKVKGDAAIVGLENFLGIKSLVVENVFQEL
ncbi:MAG: CC/Se motif family (seleno)protein [Tissierellia bacterium]|nr:CC/Se motif family (seleno)protein [Tissierellia bacterium]